MKSPTESIGNRSRTRPLTLALAGPAVLVMAGLAGCSAGEQVRAASPSPQDDVVVGVAKARRTALDRTLTLSSELVPFQEIDVYAKEAGYVQKLYVDYGSRVKAGQVLAVLEIPELQMVLEQDAAAIQNAENEVTHSRHELSRVEAQHRVQHLAFQRIDEVSKSRPGLVAQQEVDTAQGKDLESEAQIEAAKSALAEAQSQLAEAEAKRKRDEALYNYSRITAPFAGVVTQRYANLGTLLQAGTNSSTQAMPVVRLSEDDLFRLVIPVPEAYVKYIRIGDPVTVTVPSLNRSFPGRVARFSVDVKEDTRTMHTEVDIPNPNRVLIPGLYAEASVELERRANALAIPLQAIAHGGRRTTVLVVAPNGQLQAREVAVGLETASDAEILSGLRDGDQVVVSDRSSLRSGQIVRPKTVEVMNVAEQSQ